jgi:ATP-dependent Clp protease, protease subunit
MSPKKLKDLTGEIWVINFTEESAQDFRERMLFKSKDQPEEPIVVFIDSYGGYVDSLAKMIETMDEVPNPIITVCMGKAISCGAMLFAHGDVRYCGRHSRIMIHEISGGTDGSADVHNVYADAVEGKRLNRYFIGLLAKDCNIEGGYEGLRKIIKRRDGRDIYMDAEDAVAFGIADFVGLPQVVSMVQTQATTVPAKRRAKNIRKSNKPFKKQSRGK